MWFPFIRNHRDNPIKRRIRVVLFFLIFCVLGAGFFYYYAKKETAAVLHTPFEIVDKSGNRREYRVFLPPWSGDKPLPLLVYFHGVWSEEFKRLPALKHYTGSPIEETGLIELSKRKGFVLLVPEAFYEFKSLRGLPARGWQIEKEIDGIEKMIDRVAAEYKISKREIYLSGISAGAMFCHYLANKRPGVYAAIISHSQGYTDIEGRGIVLSPAKKGPRFGVLFAYCKGDYPNLIGYCKESCKKYKDAGYPVELLPDLLPPGHAWSSPSSEIFWNLLQKLAGRARKTCDRKVINLLSCFD
ncbi:MAG: hypothetical protein KAW12_19975 [Candidatus Aminicenantes bacterium]|nr:hypothetical protein [Candidatus Aminicenantes bacterium]